MLLSADGPDASEGRCLTAEPTATSGQGSPPAASPSPYPPSVTICPPSRRDAAELLTPYQQRAGQTPDGQRAETGTDSATRQLPIDFKPWWHDRVTGRLRQGAATLPVDVESLVLGALRHSDRVSSISDGPLIRRTRIVEEEAAFDWHAFVESRYDQLSEPVGNLLTTGGSPRFRDHIWNYSAGLRKKTRHGGQFEVSQRIGYRDNNSRFFVPTQQGNARLSLSFTQPLLNGAGKAYNTSLIVLAQIDTAAAEDEFYRDLQEHLIEVTRAYWDLYRQRAVLVQKQRLLERAQAIEQELESRLTVDALQSQVVRAKAAVAARQAEIIRAEKNIRDAEARLRALVNDPQLLAEPAAEFVPAQDPTRQAVPVSMRQSLLLAIKHRPEVDQAIQNVKAASVRLNMSRNELLPALDFIMETYVSGLEGHSRVGQAWVNQFGEGEPSFSVGLTFEVPLGNRAARARWQRRRLELRQVTSDLRATLEALMAEVEIAVREVRTAYREMESKYRSMLAAQAELDYREQRWRLMAGEDRDASFLLEDLLQSQERLADEEEDFVTAQVAYTLSLAELKRATGTLLEYERVQADLACQNGIPKLMLNKPKR